KFETAVVICANRRRRGDRGQFAGSEEYARDERAGTDPQGGEIHRALLRGIGQVERTPVDLDGLIGTEQDHFSRGAAGQHDEGIRKNVGEGSEHRLNAGVADVKKLERLYVNTGGAQARACEAEEIAGENFRAARDPGIRWVRNDEIVSIL